MQTNNEEKLTAKIVLMPTCSYCGYRLENQTINFAKERLVDPYPIKNITPLTSYALTPEFCPYCGATFGSIIAPAPVKFPFETKSLSEYDEL